MTPFDLKLDAQGVNRVLLEAFSEADPNAMALVQEASPGRMLLKRP